MARRSWLPPSHTENLRQAAACIKEALRLRDAGDWENGDWKRAAGFEEAAALALDWHYKKSETMKQIWALSRAKT